MSGGTSREWADYTLIDREELLDYLIETGEWERDKCQVKTYCVKPGYETIDFNNFIEFIRDKFPYFVFSSEEVEEMEYPFLEAQKRADFNDDPSHDGKLGELILFVLVDAILDMPIASHKIANKPERKQEVKGSDGLFFGKFDGHEALAVGEAKINKQRSTGIRSAMKSTQRFYETSGSSKVEHELQVASNALNSDLSPDKLERLVEVFTSEVIDYRQVHPIFVGYEKSWLRDIQEEATSPEELEEKLQAKMEDRGAYDYINEKLDEEYPELKKRWLVFLLLPLEDADRFRATLQEEIYPHSSNH